MSQPLAQTLLGFVDQAVWANQRWMAFVYGRPEPDVRPRELLSHIMLSERVWFERVEGRPDATAGTFPLLGESELRRGFAENAEVYRRLIRTRLEDDTPFRRASGVEYHARVRDVIQHLITHGYHHRGQLAAYYARSGVAYPSTDHIDHLVEMRL